KPKTARSARALKKREPKVQENTKTAIFIRGSQTSQIVNAALADLCSLKKPNAVMFSKKNDIHPFDDETPLQFFCQKNDASLFVVGMHSKKRPHNLVFVRMFDGQVLDMIEIGIEKSVSLKDIKTSKCQVGMRPLFLFNGEIFDKSTNHKMFKNMLLDFFRGQSTDSISPTGLEHVISVSADSNGKIYFRVYIVKLNKSGQRTPRVELEEMGPSFDFVIRRTKFAKEEVYKKATRIPKQLKPKKVKNVDVNEMGDKIAKIHLGKQDFDKIQTRKVKALKKRDIDTATEGEPKDEKEKVHKKVRIVG
ncbi:6295_t:CDS:2, partial [Paraglomus brasilianum]